VTVTNFYFVFLVLAASVSTVLHLIFTITGLFSHPYFSWYIEKYAHLQWNTNNYPKFQIFFVCYFFHNSANRFADVLCVAMSIPFVGQRFMIRRIVRSQDRKVKEKVSA
jgi:hypothetical protein